MITQDELDEIKKVAATPIGDIGHKFIKRLQGTWYAATVVSKVGDKRRVSKFDDGEHK